MSLLNKILLGAGAAVILITAFFIFGLLLANAHLKSQVAQEQEKATACRMANDVFADTVERQNKAVLRLKAESEALDKRAAAASKAAEAQAQLYLNAAKKMSKAKARGNACQAAEAFFNTYMAGVQ